MDFERTKENKKEYIITVTTQFSLFFTDKEVDQGVEIPHEFVVTGCVVNLASMSYEVKEDEV